MCATPRWFLVYMKDLVLKCRVHLLCLYCLCVSSCQAAGSGEFAAERSQVEKYQRDFW